jgi:hypothetical protein
MATVTLPMPTAVILDGEHVLRWIDVHSDYSTRSAPQQIFDALDHLNLQPRHDPTPHHDPTLTHHGRTATDDATTGTPRAARR